VSRDATAIGRWILGAWDAAAAGYDAQYGHAPSSAAELAAWCALLARLFPPQRPLRILDAGTGTGVVALLLASAGHRVTGIDLSTAMIAQARKKAANASVQLACVVGETGELPFADGSFDAVISRYLLWTLPEPATALAEWRRVVHAGGRIVAIDSLAPRPRPLVRLLSSAVHAVRPTRNAAPAPRAAILEAAADCPLNSPTRPDPAQRLFREAGLHHLRAIELRRLDARLRAAMPLRSRWVRGYRRYLVSATV